MNHFQTFRRSRLASLLVLTAMACAVETTHPEAKAKTPVAGPANAVATALDSGLVGRISDGHRPSWMTPQRAAEIDSIRSSPHFRQQVAKMRAIVARGEYAVALVHGAINPGVTAIVRLNQPDALRRYMVVSDQNFDDFVYHRALAAAFTYEMTNFSDDSPVTITVRDGGTVQRESESLGTTIATPWEVASHGDPSLTTGPIRQQALASAVVNLSGYGAVHLWKP